MLRAGVSGVVGVVWVACLGGRGEDPAPTPVESIPAPTAPEAEGSARPGRAAKRPGGEPSSSKSILGPLTGGDDRCGFAHLVEGRLVAVEHVRASVAEDLLVNVAGRDRTLPYRTMASGSTAYSDGVVRVSVTNDFRTSTGTITFRSGGFEQTMHTTWLLTVCD